MTPWWVWLVYGTFAAGGVAVYLMMPGGRRSAKMAGMLLGLAGLIGAMVLCGSHFLSPGGVNVLFFPSAVVAIAGAVRVITHDRPVYSALYFVLVVLAIAPLLIAQNAEFLAVALIIIYAGAILVTYVFVIMLAQQGGQSSYDRRSREPFWAVVGGFVTMAVVAGQTARLPDKWAVGGRLASFRTVADSPAGAAENVEVVGRLLLSNYMVSLEVAGVLLLIAMVGAVALSRKRVPVEAFLTKGPPPGQAGREVPPY